MSTTRTLGLLSAHSLPVTRLWPSSSHTHLVGNTMHQALGTGEKEIKDEATALWKEDFVMPSQPKGNKEIQSYNDLFFCP